MAYSVAILVPEGRNVATDKVVQRLSGNFPWDGMSWRNGNRGLKQTGWIATVVERRGTAAAAAAVDCKRRTRRRSHARRRHRREEGSELVGMARPELWPVRDDIGKAIEESRRRKSAREMREIVGAAEGRERLTDRRMRMAAGRAEDRWGRRNREALEMATDVVGRERWSCQRSPCS